VFLLPIGHEESTVRRLPWVTFTIIGLCVVAYLVTASVQVEDPNRYLIQPIQYYLSHRYLEPAPELKEAIQKQADPQLKQYLELTGPEQTPEQVPDPEVIAQEQQQLERLTDQWLQARKKAAAHPLMRGGLVPAHFSVTSLLTHLFLHVSLMHLLGNMIFLLLCGPFVEDKWGRVIYGALYLGSGIFAGAMFAVTYPSSEVPLVGASGAIAGVMGAFLIRFWNTNIKFFYTILLRPGTFDAPAWLMLPLWLASQLWAAMMMDGLDPGGHGGGVAYWAHVWGFAVGVAVGMGMRLGRIEERFITPALDAKLEAPENPVLEEAVQALEQGRAEEAFSLLREEARQHPHNGSVVLAWWDAAVGTGRAEEAAPAMLRLVRHKLGQGEVDVALEHWTEVMHKAPGVQAELALEVKLLESLAQIGRTDEARSLLEAVLGRGGEIPTVLRAKLARVAAKLGGPAAPAVIEQALACRDLPEAARHELEQVLAQLTHPPQPAAAAEAPGLAAAPQAPEVMLQAPELMPQAPDVMPPAPGMMPQAPGAMPPAPEMMPQAPAEAVWAPGPAAAPAARPRRTLQVARATPLGLSGKQLTIQADGKGQGALSLERVRAIAVGCVQKPGALSFVVLDLLLDSPESTAPTLKLVRLESTRFDPRTLVPEATSGLEAFRLFVERLLGASGARPLPDEASACGRPFRTFGSLDEYEKAVLS
jgi:membrane associated rhomboid family serine protease